MEIQIEQEGESGRIVTPLEGGDEAYVAFQETDQGGLDYRRTFVPEAHRHRGIGEELVLEALDWARENERSVIATCPFVGWVVERNPEYEDLLAR